MGEYAGASLAVDRNLVTSIQMLSASQSVWLRRLCCEIEKEAETYLSSEAFRNPSRQPRGQLLSGNLLTKGHASGLGLTRIVRCGLPCFRGSLVDAAGCSPPTALAVTLPVTIFLLNLS